MKTAIPTGLLIVFMYLLSTSISHAQLEGEIIPIEHHLQLPPDSIPDSLQVDIVPIVASVTRRREITHGVKYFGMGYTGWYRRRARLPQWQVAQYISQNIIYPQEALDLGLCGSVIVDFNIDTNGNIINPRIRGNKGKDVLNNYVLFLIEEIGEVSPVHRSKRRALKKTYSLSLMFTCRRCKRGTNRYSMRKYANTGRWMFIGYED